MTIGCVRDPGGRCVETGLRVSLAWVCTACTRRVVGEVLRQAELAGLKRHVEEQG